VKPEPGIPPMSSSPPIVVPPPVHRTLATQPTRPKEGVSCPKCRTALPGSLFNLGKLVACPGCGSPLEVSVFPALFRQIAEGKSPETILVEGEASCFYHPQKRATIPCAICGRFLCALCDVELNDQHLCPGCLDTGRKKGKLVQLETRRTLHDSSALVLSIVPVICMWPISVVTSPIAVFLAVYSCHQPASM